MERFAVKKKILQKEVNLTFTSRITIRFEITIKKVDVRFMHKQKVTKLGSLKLHLPKRKRNSCTFSYIAPLPLFNVAELQFPTETIQFCTTLNKGGGESNERQKC